MISYRGRTAWLSTKHEKLGLIAPAMNSVGLEVKAITVDTDQLGTFSGEIPRVKSPLETAIAKAKLGLLETGAELGLASEGTIGPDPQNPFLVSDIETLVFIDLANDLVIHETHRSFDIVARAIELGTDADLQAFLYEVGFPDQGLIARVREKPEAAIVKGIQEQRALAEAIEQLRLASDNGMVLVETDFRAHQSPSRRKNIEQVAQKLAKRLGQHCAKCQIPGFGKLEFRTGLRCEGCGGIDKHAISQEILCCIRCDHTEPGKIVATSLPPERCGWCNP